MSDAGWLVVALVAVGAGIGGYTSLLLVRKRRLQHRLTELHARRTD